MQTLMKLFFIALLSFFTQATWAADSASCSQSTPIIKKIKELRQNRDSNRLFLMSTCTGPGLQCTSSGDCCGASMCQDGYCSDPGVGDVSPGGRCQSSGDCQGSSMCEDGFCSDPGVGDVPPGGHCQTSGDCQGASFCENGTCS